MCGASKRMKTGGLEKAWTAVGRSLGGPLSAFGLLNWLRPT